MWVNINELKQCCKKEWAKIPPLLCERLITSYRKQFKFVLFFTWLCGLSHYLKAAFSFVFQKHQYFTDNLPCLLEENTKMLDSTLYCFTIKTHSRPKKTSLSNPKLHSVKCCESSLPHHKQHITVFYAEGSTCRCSSCWLPQIHKIYWGVFFLSFCRL